MSNQPEIRILPAAPADEPLVRRLSSYYVYDMSEHLGWPCPESGCFGGCDDFFAEWQAGKNYPYLLRIDGEPAGFAGVGVDAAAREFFIQEFFILRKFRRQGVGTAVAHHLFDRFAGDWHVELLLENTPALRFWQPAIESYLGTAPEVDERDSPWGRMQVLRFSRGVPADFPFMKITPLHDGELELHLEQAIPADVPRGWLPVYDFQMRVDDLPAGNINIRIGNTFSIVMYGGHIGYGVYPDFRGRHYAERACRLLLPLAKAHGLTSIWITTNPENAASRRTCERLGARLVEIVPLPEDNDQYPIGDREKCRYRLEI